MTIKMKGWAAANRAKCGITQYLYDNLKKVVDSIEDSSKGLAKKVTDLETAVGDSDDGLVKDVADIQTAIGDASEPAEGTILARIAALESKE